MATPYNLVSRSAQDALTEFSTAFDMALAVASPDVWSRQFGLYNSSRAIRTTYPLPVSAAGYVERKGNDRMRSLYTKSLSMQPKEWVDGVHEKATIVEAPDFIGWQSEPARIAIEATRQPNKLVASVLEANAVLEFDGVALFADSHPVNVFNPGGASFDNNVASGTYTAINATLMTFLKSHFRGIKGPNNQPLGLRMSHLIVPAAREEEAKDFLENDLLVQTIQESGANVGGVAINNRHKGTVQLVVADELTDDDMIYAVDANGPAPYILQDGGSPEEITYDKDSDLYKDSGLIGVKYVLLMAAVGALPHGIVRVDLG